MSPGSRTLPLGCGRLVVGRERRALAEEVLLGLVEEDLVRLLAAAGQAVLVHDHLEVLEPHLPGFLRDVVVDALPQLVGERLVLQAGQLSLELLALHHPRHRESSCVECLTPFPSGRLAGCGARLTAEQPGRAGGQGNGWCGPLMGPSSEAASEAAAAMRARAGAAGGGQVNSSASYWPQSSSPGPPEATAASTRSAQPSSVGMRPKLTGPSKLIVTVRETYR